MGLLIIPWSCFLQRIVKCNGGLSVWPCFCWANCVPGSFFVLPASFSKFLASMVVTECLEIMSNGIIGRETTWITWNHHVTTQKGTHFPKGGEGRKWAVRHQKTLRTWFYGCFIARHFDHERVNLQRIEKYESLYLTFPWNKLGPVFVDSFLHSSKKKLGGNWPHAIWHWSYTHTSEIIHVSYAILPFWNPRKRMQKSKFEKILPRHFFARLLLCSSMSLVAPKWLTKYHA